VRISRSTGSGTATDGSSVWPGILVISAPSARQARAVQWGSAQEDTPMMTMTIPMSLISEDLIAPALAMIGAVALVGVVFELIANASAARRRLGRSATHRGAPTQGLEAAPRVG
jgi:hypothetical protein